MEGTEKANRLGEILRLVALDETVSVLDQYRLVDAIHRIALVKDDHELEGQCWDEMTRLRPNL